MFEKILIANRGEIACRVAKTAREMGIATVAVYSEADADAMHVKHCDEAYCIGPAAASESYLKADTILEVAKKSGAQAVHPGYGFLSENAAFSEKCATNGIVFIGPPEFAITSMGSKSASKALMTEAGVPLVPGYHGDDQTLDVLKAESINTGFPQLIKASAGGGGKGMRVVEKAEDFEAALQSCKREALASFGDDKVLIERYLTAPRHVELQIFADTHGNTVHLFERDCSVQRRHQKVLEEAPAPGMTEELRAKMGKAATDAASAIGYVGAGTVEFLLDTDGSFFFMEMNTRLQVEHPVTEEITGQDLVEWQLRVAAGEALPLQQDELVVNGHAFEARVYAETPEKDFLPATGTLHLLQPPEEDEYVRVDTGVEQGDEVSVHYDPMIAKLIVWGEDRDDALRRMRKALQNYRIIGVNTNLEFLSRLCGHPAFIAAELDTGFIGQHEADLFPPQGEVPREILALSCLVRLLQEESIALDGRAASFDPHSPWGISNGWRLNQDSFNAIRIEIQEETLTIEAHYRETGYELELPGGNCLISGELEDDNRITAILDGHRFSATVQQHGQELSILFGGKNWQVTIHDPRVDGLQFEGSDNNLVSPMPGSISAVNVAVGDEVKKGDSLMVVEAMKMEHSIAAPEDGIVAEIFFQAGEQVEEGDELLSLQ